MIDSRSRGARGVPNRRPGSCCGRDRSNCCCSAWGYRNDGHAGVLARHEYVGFGWSDITAIRRLHVLHQHQWNFRCDRELDARLGYRTYGLIFKVLRVDGLVMIVVVEIVLVFALVRGEVIMAFPYTFLAFTELGVLQTVLGVSAVGAIFVLLGLSSLAIDQGLTSHGSVES